VILVYSIYVVATGQTPYDFGNGLDRSLYFAYRSIWKSDPDLLHGCANPVLRKGISNFGYIG